MNVRYIFMQKANRTGKMKEKIHSVEFKGRVIGGDLSAWKYSSRTGKIRNLYSIQG